MNSRIPFFWPAVLLGGFVSGAEAQAPIIVAQPTNEVVLAGSTTAFSVAVSGTGPFTYQWQFNGTNRAYGVTTTVAGNGTYGYSGDGGAAADAELAGPNGVAVDASGNLFIADQDNSVIREVGTNGIITTVAGNGTPGYSGDGGPATHAELCYPDGVAVDASGNLFIADGNNNRIRQVGTDGIISTVAGSGTQGHSGDGGPATSAELYWPGCVAVDASGNLFVADQYNSRIREVATNGIITTVAGNGTPGYSGDGGPATHAELNNPDGLAVDASGNVFIADMDNSRIREVAANGIITTVAGNGTNGYSGDGGAATGAELSNPRGVAVGASGNLFIADVGNKRIREVAFPGPRLVLTNVVGGNAGSYDVVVSGPHGSVTSSVVTLVVLLPPSIAMQPQSQWVAIGSNATLSVAATGTAPLEYQWYLDGAPLEGRTNTSLLVSGVAFPTARSYNVVAANPYGSVTGAVAVVTLDIPLGMTGQPVSQTNLFGSAVSFSAAVSGTGPFTYQWQFNGTNLPSAIISTVAGNGTRGYLGDGGPATSAELYWPSGVAVDAFGNLFIADNGNNVIREVGTDGTITTVAGNGAPGYYGDGGAATSAELWNPQGVAVDASGNLFIADQYNRRIREVRTDGIITTVAGDGTNGYSGDGGPATSAELTGPACVAVDAAGNLFIADDGNQRIREVGSNGIITTVAGNGTLGYSGDGGPATSAELLYPSGVFLDASGNLFIADQDNQRIREVATNGIIATVAGNGTYGYSGDGGPATSAELNDAYGVAVDASGNLFIADGYNQRIREVVFPGPRLVLTNVGAAYAGAYDVVVSGPHGSVTSSVVTLVVLLPPSIAMQPQSQGVAIGSNATLRVAATGTAPLDYQWYLDGAPLEGQTNTTLPLSAAGFTNAGSYTAVMTNLYGFVTSAVAVVTVGLAPGITQQSVSRTNLFDSAASFSVAASGTGPFSYQWQFNGTNLPYGVITTVAGNGIQGYSGDGGPASSAELDNPYGVAVDAFGNLFIANSGNGRIREVGTDGIITTVAGNGNYGYSGDGGAATSAALSWPDGVAVDASGNLFIADYDNNVIREVGTNGVIATVAGNGTNGYSGDGGAATSAELSHPIGVAVDTAGNLFIADRGNNRIREVGTNGIITTVAGNGTQGYSGDGGAATEAQLYYPSGVAVDASGNLFIADYNNCVIREVGTDGIITTVAGNGTYGFSGDGGAATGAELSNPQGVAVDASGNLFIADNGNQRIREVVAPGPRLVLANVGGANAGSYDVVVSSPYGRVTSSVVTLVVLLPPSIAMQPQSQWVAIGSNAALSVAATGTAPLDYQWYLGGAPLEGQTNATLPLSAAGFANAGSYNAVVTNLYGSVTSAVAVVAVGLPPGITTQPVSLTNLFGSTASFSVAVSGTGPFSYQWQFNGANLPYGVINTVAGNGTYGFSGDGGPATSAQLAWPACVAVDVSGNLFIADMFNQRIREVGTDGIITTVAGNGTQGYSGDGGAATNGELSNPQGVAVDASGNLFIADTGSNVIREVGTDGIITTVAGNGTKGYSGEGVAATTAELNLPAGVAVDASGNRFIADQYNWRIREVGTDGIITTVAGKWTPVLVGDGGAATEAELYPSGVAVDAAGNLFIADSGHNVIREVGTNGIIATVAGNGTNGYSGDGGAATTAELNFPSGVAVDASGNLFIADNGNRRIRQVVFPGPTLVLTNVGGGNAGSYDVVVSSPYGSITSSVATLLVLLPPSIALDPQSGWVAIGSNATLSVAATGAAPLDYQWYFDGAPLEGQTNTTLPLSAAGFTNAGSYNVVVTNLYGAVTSAVAVVTVGLAPGITQQPVSLTNLFESTASFSVAVSGTGPFTYQWQFKGTNLPSGVITTVAGNGAPGYSGDGGAATSAELNYPYGVAVDASGNFFIADEGNNVIREVGTNGIITTVAGNGTYGYSGDGGAATKAELYHPIGVAVGASGNLFIADEANQRIRMVGTDGIITTVAGNGTYGYSGDGGPATNAELASPLGVAVDASGNLFIADTDNSRIRKVGIDGIISTVAGNGTYGYSGDGGAATEAQLNSPYGVAVDAFGNLFIAEPGNMRVREVGANGTITTVAGNGTYFYSGDGGLATRAELNYPQGVAVDASGNLFIADNGNNVIREVGTNGIITTLAGNGTYGFSGDGGAATEAELYQPNGVAVDAYGNLFISDAGNSRVRLVVLAGPALLLPNVGGTNAGAYDVVVSSPYGSITSSVATLVVALNPLNVLGTGGQEVQLQFQGVRGDSYVLLSATNLTPPIDWRPVSTNAAGPNGQWVFTVTNVLSSPARFYRMSSTGQ